MSQRDLVAELRAAHVVAPPEVRQRVRLIAAAAPAARGRLTWRRAFVVLVPVAAAVAAGIALGWPSPRHESAGVMQVDHGAVAKALAPRAALSTPYSPNRVQVVGETLSLQVESISSSVKAAVRVVTSLGGYAASVHAQTAGRNGTADLTLKVPRANLQQAVTELSALGTITGEHVDVGDRTAALNATDRLIARLQAQRAALRAQNAPAGQIAALTTRIEGLQRQEAAVRRAAHYATLQVHLGT